MSANSNNNNQLPNNGVQFEADESSSFYHRLQFAINVCFFSIFTWFFIEKFHLLSCQTSQGVSLGLISISAFICFLYATYAVIQLNPDKTRKQRCALILLAIGLYIRTGCFIAWSAKVLSLNAKILSVISLSDETRRVLFILSIALLAFYARFSTAGQPEKITNTKKYQTRLALSILTQVAGVMQLFNNQLSKNLALALGLFGIVSTVTTLFINHKIAKKNKIDYLPRLSCPRIVGLIFGAFVSVIGCSAIMLFLPHAPTYQPLFISAQMLIILCSSLLGAYIASKIETPNDKLIQMGLL
jgi:hypothetical protein